MVHHELEKANTKWWMRNVRSNIFRDNYEVMIIMENYYFHCTVLWVL